jgi:hypothetical protein
MRILERSRKVRGVARHLSSSNSMLACVEAVNRPGSERVRL